MGAGSTMFKGIGRVSHTMHCLAFFVRNRLACNRLLWLPLKKGCLRPSAGLNMRFYIIIIDVHWYSYLFMLQADGTRYLLLICRWGCYFMDRAFKVRRMQLRFLMPDLANRHHLTILDGEMVSSSVICKLFVGSNEQGWRKDSAIIVLDVGVCIRACSEPCRLWPLLREHRTVYSSSVLLHQKVNISAMQGAPVKWFRSGWKFTKHSRPDWKPHNYCAANRHSPFQETWILTFVYHCLQLISWFSAVEVELLSPGTSTRLEAYISIEICIVILQNFHSLASSELGSAEQCIEIALLWIVKLCSRNFTPAYCLPRLWISTCHLPRLWMRIWRQGSYIDAS